MESTLTLKRSDYKEKVGLFLGWGRGAAQADVPWSDLQDAQLDEFVNSGHRNFYFPAIPGGAAYEWSFLRPTANLSFPLGEQTIDLPDDFGGLEGEGSLLASTSTMSWPIRVCSEGMIRKKFVDAPTYTGQPELAAVVPVKGTGTAQSTRFQLMLWPIAQDDYTIQFQYYVLPEALSDAFPYSLGGAAHVETILESCLAVAEQRLNDMAGIHTEKFRERLAASMAYDRRFKPQTFGFSTEGRREWINRRDLLQTSQVTFAGVTNE